MSIIDRNHVQIKGNGERTIVFAHGFGCDQNMWRLVAPAFEPNVLTVVFDHVGAGNSDLSTYDPQKYSSLSGYAEDIVEIGRELRLSKSIFVGHSVSAMIGVIASLKAPDLFESLVLIGPSPRYIDDREYTGGFSFRKSTNFWNRSMTITWAGRRRWHQRSWATPIGRNSAKN